MASPSVVAGTDLDDNDLDALYADHFLVTESFTGLGGVYSRQVIGLEHPCHIVAEAIQPEQWKPAQQMAA